MYKLLLILCLFLSISSCKQEQVKTKAVARNAEMYGIALPPLTPPSTQAILNYLQWVTINDGNMPAHAIYINNADGSRVYVCRATILNNLEPGEVIKNGCQITYAGKALVVSNYEVLVSNLRAETNWRFPSNIPQQKKCSTSRTPSPQRQNPPIYFISKGIAVPAPFSTMPNVGGLKFSCTTEPVLPYEAGKENNQPLYVCVAIYNSAFHIGKLIGNQCSISSETGKEIFLPPYEILFDNANQ